MRLKFNSIFLIIFFVFCLSLPSIPSKVYAKELHTLEIYVPQSDVLILDNETRKNGIRLLVWDIKEELRNNSSLEKLNDLSKKDLDDLYGEASITEYSNDSNLIYLSIQDGKRYYIREYIETEHKYELIPIIVDNLIEGGVVYMKVYNDFSPPPKIPNDPKPSQPSKRGKISFMKIADNANKTALSGVSFKITREFNGKHETLMRNNEEYILTSDENGIFVAEDLEYGKYYLWEIKPLSGYKGLSSSIEFIIDDKVSENKLIVIKNSPITKIDIPKTGDITLILILCLGISFYIMGNTLVKQNKE